ncbi:MAG: tetratricopeptide repeat protein [Spirochaetes bacterium]|nr:tetratricopeptide repeat protein [Spirochaetota bacterium]
MKPSLLRYVSAALAALACILLITSPGAAEAAPAAAGFVASIQGTGYILRRGDTIMISGMDLLYQRDTVRLNRGAAARITLCGGRGYAIRGAAVFIVRGARLAFKKGRAIKTYRIDTKTCLAALDAFGKNETTLPEMLLRGRKGTLILRPRKKQERDGVSAPRGGKKRTIALYADRLMPQRPFFAWTPVPGRASYLLRIKNGDDPLWTVTVTKNSYEYPQGAPPLEEGRVYNVSIRALSGEGALMVRGDDTFSLFTKEEVKSIRKGEESIMSVTPEESADREILLGKLAEARGELDSALSCYEKARELDPRNTGLRERIKLLKSMLEQT